MTVGINTALEAARNAGCRAALLQAADRIDEDARKYTSHDERDYRAGMRAAANLLRLWSRERF